MDRLQAMETFVRVVESGSFSAVAREQGSVQSAVSKQVAALEAYLKVKLLTRTTRKLVLTPEGERYFEQVRRLVVELQEAEMALSSAEQQLKGLLRVAAPVGFGRLILMPLVHSFLLRHPLLKIDLRLDDSVINLVEHGIDITVRFGELADSGLIAKRIGSTCRMLLCSRGYLRNLPPGLAAPRQPQDLLAHNCIVYNELANRNEWRFHAGPGANAPAGQLEVVLVNGNLQTNSSEVIRAGVIAGIGICYAPSWLFEAEIASGEVQVLLPDWLAAPMPIHLVSPPQRRQAAKVRAFADHVAQALGKEQPPLPPR